MFHFLFPIAKAGTFFDVSDVATPSLAYTGNFINDFKPLLVLIIGLLLGIIIISVIINALRG
jgi:hypothetical protein